MKALFCFRLKGPNHPSILHDRQKIFLNTEDLRVLSNVLPLAFKNTSTTKFNATFRNSKKRVEQAQHKKKIYNRELDPNFN